ncbi:MAG: 50S ribosomal protein L4 [Flavobacteriaceae bacterium]|jgi:large subunit ribosomal protein L4|nr:50S ribosomal protein L4 [Flavobacteriaceae bacterium]MCH1385497.1 50S ribosomal protein L4 [Flavobacteriaceae bacterium]MDG0966826.1 50S ribosomal protein L4 [Flavobacteriaceae bacterium]
MKVSVVDQKGKDTGRQVDLSKEVFGVEPNEHAVYLDVKQYLAHQRQGTHKAKERAEITGSTRKIKKQKGTGTARAGSMKNPLFRTGGRVFGPRVRSYDQKINKNVKRLARKSALSLKAKNKSLTVVEDFDFDTPKTKSFSAVLNALGVSDKKALLVLGSAGKNVYLSARNLQGAEVVTDAEISTYKIINAQHLILAESAVTSIVSNLNTK